MLGRQLKLDANNDDASATLSGQLFAKLVSAGAVAIAGSPDTGPVTAELAIRHKIPTIGVVDDGGLTVYRKGPDERSESLGLRFWSEHVRRGARRSANTRSSIVPTADWRCCHDPTTYGEGGNFGIKLAYDKAGKKIAMDQAITENWSTGATIGLMPQVNAIKAAGLKCVVVWLTPQDQAAFVQDLHSVGYDATVFGNDETECRRHFRKARRRPWRTASLLRRSRRVCIQVPS